MLLASKLSINQAKKKNSLKLTVSSPSLFCTKMFGSSRLVVNHLAREIHTEYKTTLGVWGCGQDTLQIIQDCDSTKERLFTAQGRG